MPEGRKNIESYLDDKLSQTLQSQTSSDFTYELIKRVKIENEFAKEDVKTSRIAKYVVGGFIFLLTAFVVMFTILVNTNEDSKDVGLFNSIVEKFSDSIESLSVIVADTLGIAFTFQTGIIFLLVMVCVFLFYFADKIIFRKSLK